MRQIKLGTFCCLTQLCTALLFPNASPRLSDQRGHKGHSGHKDGLLRFRAKPGMRGSVLRFSLSCRQSRFREFLTPIVAKPFDGFGSPSGATATSPSAPRTKPYGGRWSTYVQSSRLMVVLARRENTVLRPRHWRRAGLGGTREVCFSPNFYLFTIPNMGENIQVLLCMHKIVKNYYCKTFKLNQYCLTTVCVTQYHCDASLF